MKKKDKTKTLEYWFDVSLQLAEISMRFRAIASVIGNTVWRTAPERMKKKMKEESYSRWIVNQREINDFYDTIEQSIDLELKIKKE